MAPKSSAAENPMAIVIHPPFFLASHLKCESTARNLSARLSPSSSPTPTKKPCASPTTPSTASPAPSSAATSTKPCASPSKCKPASATSTVPQFTTSHKCPSAASKTAATAASAAKPPSKNSPSCAGSQSAAPPPTTQFESTRIRFFSEYGRLWWGQRFPVGLENVFGAEGFRWEPPAAAGGAGLQSSEKSASYFEGL